MNGRAGADQPLPSFIIFLNHHYHQHYHSMQAPMIAARWLSRIGGIHLSEHIQNSSSMQNEEVNTPSSMPSSVPSSVSSSFFVASPIIYSTLAAPRDSWDEFYSLLWW